MVTVQVHGKPYEIEFNLYTLEMIEAKYGGYKDLVKQLREKQVTTTADLFRMMVNTAQEAKGLEENATGRELRRLRMDEMNAITQVMLREIASGMRMETGAGNVADDEHLLGYEDEKKKTGGKSASGSSTDTP